jgi:hypothetical protein
MDLFNVPNMNEFERLLQRNPECEALAVDQTNGTVDLLSLDDKP